LFFCFYLCFRAPDDRRALNVPSMAPRDSACAKRIGGLSGMRG
jgi:hypothetical protein